jgi:GTP-binding protein
MKSLDEAAVNYQVVLTKIDKTKPAELERTKTALARELAKHVAAHPLIMPTSAQDGIGIAELRAELAALAVDSPFG